MSRIQLLHRLRLMDVKVKFLIRRYSPKTVITWLCCTILPSVVLVSKGAWSTNYFLLDMPWPDRFHFDLITSQAVKSFWPFYSLFWLLNQFIPAWLIQRLLLITIMGLAAGGIINLLRQFVSNNFLLALGSLIFVINPYLLDRLDAGQWIVMAGYAYLPWFIKSIVLAFQKQHSSEFKRLYVLWVMYALISIHWWYMSTLLLLPLIAYLAITNRNRLKKLAFRINIRNYWLILLGIALVFTIFSYRTNVGKFTNDDFIAFSTQPTDNLRALPTVLTLRGFWYSDGGLRRSAEYLWQIVCLLLLSSTIYGMYLLAKNNSWLRYYLPLIGSVIIVLSLGYSNDISAQITEVFRHVFYGFNGLRDSQKFVGFIAFGYAFCLPYVLAKIRFTRHSISLAAVSILTALFVVSGLTMLYSQRQRLTGYSYPDGWRSAQKAIDRQAANKILVLPWESYMDISFAKNQRVANPATIYFGPKAKIRQSNDNKLLDDLSKSPGDNRILSLKRSPEALNTLRNQGYDYIMLLNQEDAASYLVNLEDAGLENIFSDPEIKIFKL